MITISTLIASSVLLHIACADNINSAAEPIDDILGGVDVNPSNDDFEWVALMVFETPGKVNKGRATASLIQSVPPVLLTAEHNFNDITYNAAEGSYYMYSDKINIYFDVGRGKMDKITEKQDAKVRLQMDGDSHISRQTGAAVGNKDIAIVFIDRDSLDSAAITALNAISVPTLASELTAGADTCTAGDSVTLVGYGLDGTWYPNNLQRTTMKCYDFTLCTRYRGWVKEGEMCYRDYWSSSSCPGDSGSPVIEGDVSNGDNAVLVGVHGWGSPSGCGYRKTSGGESVAYWRDWIDDEMAAQAEKYANKRNNELVHLNGVQTNWMQNGLSHDWWLNMSVFGAIVMVAVAMYYCQKSHSQQKDGDWYRQITEAHEESV